MFGLRQVGYLVGFGPMFVAPVSDNKQVIIQTEVESNGWVARVKSPDHVAVLNSAGGGAFPYTKEQCGLGEYQNLQVVSLGIDNYLLPNFSQDLKGFINPYTDWKSVSFKAPNLIRNKAEWDYYGGNPGTPPTPTPTPYPVPLPSPTPTQTPTNTGSNPGTTTPVYIDRTPTPTTAAPNLQTPLVIGGFLLLAILILRAQNS